jgi:hypothetical protein
LVDPDGGIHGQTLAIERFELRRAGAWLDDGPEAGDTHRLSGPAESLCWCAMRYFARHGEGIIVSMRQVDASSRLERDLIDHS